MPPFGQALLRRMSATIALCENLAEQVAAKQIGGYKDEVKQKRQLPEGFQDASQQKVISAAVVRPDERSPAVTAVLGTAMGKSQTLIQAEPFYWLAAHH